MTKHNTRPIPERLMRPLLGLLALVVLATFVSLDAAKAAIWFGPPPPVLEVPKLAPPDYLDLFKANSPWQQVASKVSVFVLPPSVPELERRLRARAQDSDAVIRSRMERAGDEMSHWAEYDYVVINNDIDQALKEVRAILAAERLRRERQIGLSTFVRSLQSDL